MGLILLAARIYERAILHIGAPVKLGRLFTAAAPRLQRAEVGAEADWRSRSLDIAGRVSAIALLLGGAAIGLSNPVGIGLIAAGLLLIAARERRKRQPPRGAAR